MQRGFHVPREELQGDQTAGREAGEKRQADDIRILYFAKCIKLDQILHFSILYIFNTRLTHMHSHIYLWTVPRASSNALIEKNRGKLKFQWIFTDGVEWKSYIIEISTIYGFHSTPPVNTYWIFNFHRFFSNSVRATWGWTRAQYYANCCALSQPKLHKIVQIISSIYLAKFV